VVRIVVGLVVGLLLLWSDPGLVAVPFAPARPAVAVAAAPSAAQPAPFVKEVFDLLLDQYITPPDSATLLNGGWDGALSLLKALRLEGRVVERPSLNGTRDQDWAAFVESYPRLTEAVPSEVGPVKLDQAIARGMAAALRSSHTSYRSAEEVARQASRYEGVGLRLTRGFVVVEVFEGAPAALAGVRAGDQLLAIDGSPLQAATTSEATPQLRGAAGTTVQLTLQRVGLSEPIVLSVVRGEVAPAWVIWRLLDDRIGYLKLRKITPAADGLQAFDAATSSLAGADLSGLILDLRGNPGGYVSTLRQIASRFMPSGAIFQQTNRSGDHRTFVADGSSWGLRVPMVVLIDQGTGSSAELLASALRENGLARLLGTKSAGAVAGGQYFPLSDGAELHVTVLTVTSGQGQVLEGVGLEPDQTVELNLRELGGGHDTQLEAAQESLRQQRS
jgi:carboxyl-terminal processing protease